MTPQPVKIAERRNPLAWVLFVAFILCALVVWQAYDLGAPAAVLVLIGGAFLGSRSNA